MQNKIIRRMAGDRHHLYEMQQLEKLLYTSFDLDVFYEKLIKELSFIAPERDHAMTVDDLQQIDNFVKRELESKLPDVEKWIVRAFVIGKMIGERELSKIPQIEPLNISLLPARVKDAVRQNKLTRTEANALNWSITSGAKGLTNATREMINRVSNVVYDSLQKREGSRVLRNRLEEEFFNDEKEINRNWNRVAITEANAAFNQGYIAQMQGGEFVIGFTVMDDRTCDYCKTEINGKLLMVIPAEEAQDYSNLEPASEEYNRRSWIQDNCTWVGKDNHGRSASPNKREGEVLIPREHHELYSPSVPAHPSCRCRWIRIHPVDQFVDASGYMKMRVMDPEAHKEWFGKTFVPFMQAARKNGLNYSV